MRADIGCLIASLLVVCSCSSGPEPATPGAPATNATLIERLALAQGTVGPSAAFGAAGNALSSRWLLRLRATPHGLSFTPANTAETWALDIEHASHATAPRIDGARAVWSDASGTEISWTNGALAPQLIVKPQRDADAGAPAIFSFTTRGLTPSPGRNGSVVLRDAAAKTRLAITAPLASDAAGHDLRAVWRIEGSCLDLVVDDRDADYPIVIDPLVTRLETTLTHPGAAFEDYFGWDVAIDGDTAVVAVWNDDTPAGTDSGSVDVFVRGPSGWTHQANLIGAMTAAGDELGASVDIDGDTIAVGSTRARRGTTAGVGAAHVFHRSGTTWTEEARFQPAELRGAAAFGSAVAVSGSTVAVGAYIDSSVSASEGSTFVFVRSTTGAWTQQARVLAATPRIGENFGYAIDLEGDTLAVGAYGATAGGLSFAGATYMYTRSAGTWTQRARLTAATPTTFAAFGTSVNVSGTVLAVGTPTEDVGTVDGAGVVYVFDGGPTAWVQRARLVAPGGVAGDHFGNDVTFAGARLVVGADGENPGGLLNAGGIHIYEGSGASWTHALAFTAAAPGAGEGFGATIDADGSLVIVGAPTRDLPGATSQGAAEIHRIGSADGDPCTSDAPCATGFCVDGVCCATACGAGSTTDCTACSVTAGGTTNGTCTPLVAARAATTVCRPAASLCDAPETCEAGIATCPTDVIAPAGAECRPSAGTCDVPESCDGVIGACPPDVVVASGTECRASAGDCDVAEACDGVAGACPADAFAPTTVECRASTGVCDAAEHCSGTAAACPADRLAGAETTCRASAAPCDAAEVCSGMSAVCPADIAAADGASCSDGAACNGPETCVSGTCMAGSSLACDDSNACTTDSCEEPAGCSSVPIDGCCTTAAECDDGDPCTEDLCSGDACMHAAIDGGCGVESDGGPVRVDSGADSGAAPPPPAADEGGCGCRIAGHQRTPATPIALVVLAVSLMLCWPRRRRRR